MKKWLEYIKESVSEDVSKSEWIKKVNDTMELTYSLQDMCEIFTIRYQYFNFDISKVYGKWIVNAENMPSKSDISLESQFGDNDVDWYPGIVISIRGFSTKKINEYDLDSISEYYRELSELKDRLSSKFDSVKIVQQESKSKISDSHCYNIIVLDKIGLI